MARFMIFTRQQQATQKAAGSSTNDGASMDLLGSVPAVPAVSYDAKRRAINGHQPLQTTCPCV